MSPDRAKIRPMTRHEAPMAILFLSDSGIDGSDKRETIKRQTGSQTGRQVARETDRQADRER